MPRDYGFGRRVRARLLRQAAAQLAFDRPHPLHRDNGDEFNQPGFVAAFSKGLPHDPATGEVLPAAYRLYLRAVQSGDPEDWERVPLGAAAAPMPRKLTNPQSGLAFELEGPDPQAVTLPPAPTFSSAETAAEMAELYWMALLRDVSFIHYGTGAGTDTGPDFTADATAFLTNLHDFTGPGGLGSESSTGVTAANLFRGSLPGDGVGPYVSQFLLRGVNAPSVNLLHTAGVITYGPLRIEQQQYTAQSKATAAPQPVDFLTTFPEWRDSQNGVQPAAAIPVDPARLFIRNGRDLAHRVRSDRAYQHYLNACLILMNIDPFASAVPDRNPMDGTDPGTPYGPPPAPGKSQSQEGFATFGDWHVLTLLAEVTTRALDAVWYQKFFVHRRLRPEEFGGRVFVRFNNNVGYNINSNLLNQGTPSGTNIPAAPTRLLDRVHRFSGGAVGAGSAGATRLYLLPQAYPEGSPLHPAYGSGHATVAGACVTVLKAWFDENWTFGPGAVNELGSAVQPNAAGTALVATGDVLTVGGELNKLASNASLGRNFAGVHYRSDYIEAVRLGEEVAVQLLQEDSLRYNENRRQRFPPSFTLTRFDGRTIRIERGRVIDAAAAYARIGSTPTGFLDG